jgi:hypothetical protein
MEDTLSVDTLLDACRHAGETLAVMVDGASGNQPSQKFPA